MIHSKQSHKNWWGGIRRVASSTALIALALAFSFQATVLAYTPQERRDMLEKGISFVDDECTTAASSQLNQPPDVDGALDRDANAAIIIGIAKTLGLGQRGALIGIMTAITEGGLKNYANDGSDGYQNTILGPYSISLPHEAVGNDHDSVGLFQQRAVDGHWGPVNPKTNLPDNIKWLMTPSYSAEAFFAMPQGKEERKALVNVPHWQTIDPGEAAQAVQGSAFPDRYAKNQKKAQEYINRLYDNTDPKPLPVPLAGGGAPTAPSTDVAANPDCGKLITAGGSAAILEYIKLYAWPTYCNKDASSCNGRSSPLTAKTEYAKAILATYKRMADGKADYLGDPCGRVVPNEVDEGTNRVGIDCGGFVTRVMRDSGADPTYNSSTCDTSCQLKYLQKNSGAGKKYTKVGSEGALKPGDIAVKDGHTFFYVGDGIPDWGGKAASASQCQRAPMAGPMDDFGSYEWFHLN